MSDNTLELDQEDIAGRLQADPLFVDTIKVFAQRRGVTENDVMTALGATNQQGQKVGLVCIVLMPRLTVDNSASPGPRYFTRYGIQVIDWPLMRRVAGGAGVSAESVAQRIRQILHYFAFGRGQTVVFDAMEPAQLQDETQVSYILYFKRLGVDNPGNKVIAPTISPAGGAVPQTVSFSGETAGAEIWYTTDGSYPSSENATATLYTGSAFTLSTACTLRVAAERAGYQQSNVLQAIFT
jgi:hypothetical protein